MPLMLYAILAARIVAGLVLRNGGETPLDDLQEAMRVRQYLLLNSPDMFNVPHVSLLATGTDEVESDLDVLGESAESIAQTASFDAVGFDGVAATKSTAAMEAFVRRLLDSQDLRVEDEAFMRGVLPYYTGECANQSFSALTDELLRAKTSRACKHAWIVAKSAAPVDMDNTPLQPYTAQDTERAAVVLVRGVMAELGATVPVKSGNFKRTWQFVTQFMKEDGNLASLQQKLSNTTELQEWINFESPAHEPTFAGEGAVSSWLTAIGQVAPLNEDGYRAVVYTRDENEMASSIRRVAKHEGFNIANKDGLAGMTPYYSGKCARQTYDALVRELHSLVGQGFTMRFAYEATSQDMANLAELKTMIAQRAGVDVSSVTIENIDDSKFAERMQHYAEKRMQRAAENHNPPSMVAEEESRPLVGDDEAHGNVDRKRVQVTIAVDSAPKVTEIRKSLRAASFPSGHSRASFFKAEEVESAKPKQCGGGLLVPK